MPRALIGGGIVTTELELAGIVLGSLLVFVSSLARGGLNPDRRLLVSEQGIRLERLVGSRSALWWNVSRVRAKPDLSELRVDASGGGVTIQTSGLKEQGRANIVVALRARLPADHAIEAWRPSRLNREGAANACGLIGSMFLVAALYLGPAISGTSLGIRCSGPSSYFDARFSLPSGQLGCVVVRVSGAAARAGVREGDRMIAMNGAPITSGPQFNDRFYGEGSDEFEFTFVRGGSDETFTIHVTPGHGSSPETPDTDPIAWFLRARGNPDQAQSIQQYARAIQLAPDFDLAYVYRGELEFANNDFGASLSDLQRALVANPNSAEAYDALARYYEGQVFVDPRVPRMYVQRAIELHHCIGGFVGTNLDCAEDYVLLADLLRFRTDTPGSIAAAVQAIPFYDRTADPLYQLALSNEVAGDKDLAASYARQYLARPASDRTDAGSRGMRALLVRVGDAGR